jgi:uncharacterized membrane protein
MVPVAVTIYAAYFVVALFDKLVPVGIPGLGIVVTAAVVTFVGFMTTNVLGHAVVSAAERWLSSLPFLKLVYGSIRDLVQAFVGDKKRFDKPVAVTLMPGSPIQLLGFVTRTTLAELGKADRVAVYVPQSYNFAGNLLIAPPELVEPLDASSTDLMAFIVSGGVSGFGEEPGQKPPSRSSPARTILGLGPRRPS